MNVIRLLKKIGTTIKGVIERPTRTGAILVGNKMDGTILPSIYFHTDPSLCKISDRVLTQHNLFRWQFVYTPSFMEYRDKKDEKKVKIPIYVGESKDLVIRGMILWKRECYPQFGKHIEQLTILTDNGQAWKFDGGSLLGSIGVKKHEYLASLAHAYMSTCDNGTNGPAKQIWRAAARRKDPPYTNVLRSTCVLLKASQSQSAAYVKNCWRRNFLLDVAEDEIDDEFMKQRFNKTTPKWLEFHAQCKSDYKDYMSKTGDWIDLRTEGTARKKNTGLNGPYYDDYDLVPKRLKL